MKAEQSYSTLLVVLQFVLSGCLVVATRVGSGDGVQCCLVAAGVCFGLWAIATVGLRKVKVMPEVDGKTELVTHGPFRFVRHPMYSALTTVSIGLAGMPFQVWKLAVVLGLVIVLYLKSRIEERALLERFENYGEYQRRTKRFIPYVL